MKSKIISVDYGVSSVYNDGTIEINRKITVKLRKDILAHEKRHEIGKYSLVDFKNDFSSQDPHFFKVFYLALRNPEMLVGYMPFMYSYYFKKWSFNSSSMFPLFEFGFIFCLFWSLIYISLDISPFVGFFTALIWWFNLIVMINLSLLTYTHVYVQKHFKS